MGIIRTDEWLKEDGITPHKMCERLVKLFPDGNASSIYLFLVSNGMYKNRHISRKFIDRWSSTIPWEKLSLLFKKLKKDWDGPNIPIFTFPVDTTNSKIRRELRGKCGIAFSDKLFLFLPIKIDWKEIEALLTHEYNHTCRLNNLKLTEKDCTLLDACLLEGLAESAVKERVGEIYISQWTNYYSKRKLVKYYQHFLKKNNELTYDNQLYYELLYGSKKYPALLGYSIGYCIVQDVLKFNKYVSVDDLLRIKSVEILKQAHSFQ